MNAHPHTASTPFIRFITLSLCYALLISPLTGLAAPTPQPALAPKSNTNNKAKRGKRANELIVRFREGTSEEAKRQVLETNDGTGGGGGSKRRLRGAARLEKLKFAGEQDVDALAAELKFNPAVELVEPNFIISPDDTTPNDPRFSEQWSLRNTGTVQGSRAGADIGVTGAWDTTTGAPTTTIAVLDKYLSKSFSV